MKKESCHCSHRRESLLLSRNESPIGAGCDTVIFTGSRILFLTARKRAGATQLQAARCFLWADATDDASTRRISRTASGPPSVFKTFLSTTSDSNERRALATWRPRPRTTAEARLTSGTSRSDALEGSRVVLVDFLLMAGGATGGDDAKYSALEPFCIHDTKYAVCAGNGDEDDAFRMSRVSQINAMRVQEAFHGFFKCDPMLLHVFRCFDRVPLELAYLHETHGLFRRLSARCVARITSRRTEFRSSCENRKLQGSQCSRRLSSADGVRPHVPRPTKTRLQWCRPCAAPKSDTFRLVLGTPILFWAARKRRCTAQHQVPRVYKADAAEEESAHGASFNELRQPSRFTTFFSTRGDWKHRDFATMQLPVGMKFGDGLRTSRPPIWNLSVNLGPNHTGMGRDALLHLTTSEWWVNSWRVVSSLRVTRASTRKENARDGHPESQFDQNIGLLAFYSVDTESCHRPGQTYRARVWLTSLEPMIPCVGRPAMRLCWYLPLITIGGPIEASNRVCCTRRPFGIGRIAGRPTHWESGHHRVSTGGASVIRFTWDQHLFHTNAWHRGVVGE